MGFKSIQSVRVFEEYKGERNIRGQLEWPKGFTNGFGDSDYRKSQSFFPYIKHKKLTREKA